MVLYIVFTGNHRLADTLQNSTVSAIALSFSLHN